MQKSALFSSFYEGKIFNVLCRTSSVEKRNAQRSIYFAADYIAYLSTLRTEYCNRCIANFGSAIQNAIETNIVGEEEKGNTSQEDAVEIVEDQTVIDKMEDKLNEKVDQVVTEGKEALTEKIIATTFYGIGFLITFIGVKITLFIAFAIVEFIFKLPVLNAFNKLVGGILEVVLMLAKLWMVLGLISFIAPLDFMQKVVELINGSVITKLLYDNNIIVTLIIGKII